LSLFSFGHCTLHFHCSAVQREPITVFMEIALEACYCALLWNRFYLNKSNRWIYDISKLKFLITVWEPGGWGWFLTDNFRICCLLTANLVGWFGPKYQSVSKCENACALKIQDIFFATRYLIIAYLFIALSICLKNDQPVSFAFCVRKIFNREIRMHWTS